MPSQRMEKMAHVVAAAAVNSGDFMKWKTDCSNAVGFFVPKNQAGFLRQGPWQAEKDPFVSPAWDW